LIAVSNLKIRLDECYLFLSSFAILCFKLKHLLNILSSVELAKERCYSITVASILSFVDPFALNGQACSSTGMYLIFSVLLFFCDFKWSKTWTLLWILLWIFHSFCFCFCFCNWLLLLLPSVVPVRLLLLLLMLTNSVYWTCNCKCMCSHGYRSVGFPFQPRLIFHYCKRGFFFRLTRINPSNLWPDHLTGSMTRLGFKTMVILVGSIIESGINITI
jgi:hypothetical protein